MMTTDEKLTGVVNARLDADTEKMLIALCQKHYRNRSDMTRMLIRKVYAATFNQPETRAG